MFVELLWLAGVLGLLLCGLAYQPAWRAKWFAQARVRLAFVADQPVWQVSKELTISQDPGGGFALFAWATRTGPPGFVWGNDFRSSSRTMVRAVDGAR